MFVAKWLIRWEMGEWHPREVVDEKRGHDVEFCLAMLGFWMVLIVDGCQDPIDITEVRRTRHMYRCPVKFRVPTLDLEAEMGGCILAISVYADLMACRRGQVVVESVAIVDIWMSVSAFGCAASESAGRKSRK